MQEMAEICPDPFLTSFQWIEARLQPVGAWSLVSALAKTGRDGGIATRNSRLRGVSPVVSSLEHSNPNQTFVRSYYAAQLVGAVRLVPVG